MADKRTEKYHVLKCESRLEGELERNLDDNIDDKLDENLDDKAGQVVRYATLSLLYLVQGAPYGFQTSCLPLLLRQAGLSFSSLSVMKLLFLPWVCKPLYSPLLERTLSRSTWLIVALATMAMTCLLASFTVNQADVTSLSLVLLLLNFASAAQDVCVDALALEILRPSELGAGNTIQVVAYKIGAVTMGSMLLWVSQISGWTSMWLVFAVLYFIATGLALLVLLPKSQVNAKQDFLKEEKISLSVVVRDLKAMVAVPGTNTMLSFVLFYKLAERGENLIPLFLVDKQVPVASLGFWTGAVRSCASLAGSALAGFLISVRGTSPHLLLKWSAWVRCLPVASQLLVVSLWPQEDFPPLLYAAAITTLSVSAFVAGILTTACFTTMMQLSRSAGDHLQASHYSLLSTMEVAGKLAFASVSGIIIDTFGLQVVLLLLLLLAFLTPHLVPEQSGTQTTSEQKRL